MEFQIIINIKKNMIVGERIFKLNGKSG